MTRRKLLALSVAAPLALASVLAVAVSCGSGSKEKPFDADKLVGKIDWVKTAEQKETLKKGLVPYGKSNNFTNQQYNEARSVGDAIINHNITTIVKGQTNERRQTYFSRANAEHNVELFDYDVSTSYGSGTALTSTNLTGEQWFRIARRGETKITKKASLSGNSDQYTVVSPSEEWVQLSLAGEIQITLWDNTTVNYTNSKHEIRPEWDNKSNSLRLLSADAQSVNNPKFWTDLKNARQVKLLTRENVYWTDNKGGKTQYKLQAEDFYYSWMRTQLYDFNFRKSNGMYTETKTIKGKQVTVDGLAAQMDAVNGSPVSRFSNKNSFPNGYLLELFGVDLKGLNDRTKTLTAATRSNGTQTTAFTFNVSSELIEAHKNNANSKKRADLDKYFISLLNDNTFMPAPSAFIKQEQNNAASHVDAKVTNLSKVNGLAKEFGFYWYGIDEKNTLFVGAYLPQEYDKAKATLTYISNPNYWDQEWAKSPNSIKKYVTEYKNKKIDETTFQTELFNAFKSGLIDNLSFDSLSAAQKKEVLQDKGELYRLDYGRGTNNNHSAYQLLQTMVPEGDDAKKFKYYNDNYAKLVFNATKEELAKQDVSTINSQFGLSASFRSIVRNVINYYAHVSLISSGKRVPNLSGVAIDAKFNDKVTQTPRQVMNELNNISVIGVDGKKLNFGTASSPKTVVTYEDLKSFATQTELEKQLKFPFYDVLKSEMKKLLDKFYTDNNIPADEKVEWNQYFRFVNANSVFKDNVNVFIKLVNGLDPRLSFKYTIAKSGPELFPTLISGIGVHYFSGWGYDYEGFASYLTGLANANQGSLVALLSGLLSQSNNVKETYPQLLKLAEIFKSTFQSNDPAKPYYLAYDFAQLANVPNKYLLNFSNLNQLKFENNKFVVMTAEESKNLKETFDTAVARFFLEYVQNNQDLTLANFKEMVNEINTLYGWDFGVQLEVSLDSYSTSISNPKYIIPNSSSTIGYLQDFHVVLNNASQK